MKIVEFEQSLESIVAAKKWLQKLGFMEKDLSRINSLIPYLQNCKANRGNPLPKSEQDKYISCLFDAASFSEIFGHFSKFDLSNEKDTLGKLKLACRSRTLKDDENNSRDHLFELEFATLFNKHHVNVSNYDDLQIVLDSTPINFECKRISSPKKVGANVIKAISQLQTSFTTEVQKGCIVLSLEKIIDANGTISGQKNLLDPILSNDPNFNSEEFVKFLSKRICSQYRSIWANILDIRIIAIIHVFRFVVRIGEADNIHFSFALVPLVGGRTGRLSDQFLLQRITRIVE